MGFRIAYYLPHCLQIIVYLPVPLHECTYDPSPSSLQQIYAYLQAGYVKPKNKPETIQLNMLHSTSGVRVSFQKTSQIDARWGFCTMCGNPETQ